MAIKGYARVNWLTRSIADRQDIVRLLEQKGVTLKATEQPMDTSSAAGKAFPRCDWRVRCVREEPS